MLKQRIVTAVVMLMIFLPALFHPNPQWIGLLGVLLVSLAAWEWGRLNGMGFVPAFALPVINVVFFLIYGLLLAKSELPRTFWLTCVAVWSLTVIFFLKQGVTHWQVVPQPARLLLGVCLLISTGLALWHAKLIGNGFLISVLAVVWAADISAYFVGRRWGKHKLAPTISPGKSVEGLIGAIFAVMCLAVAWLSISSAWQIENDSIFARLLQFGWVGLFAGLVLLTLTSAAGDLFESLIKRAAGAKDSSQLLPGHGGILDRLDALLPVLPLAVCLSKI